jgi:hypothetical protein
VKFRRKNADEPATETVSGQDAAPDAAGADPSAPATPPAPRTDGPHDIADVEDDGIQRVDLGSVLVPPVEGRELRMQVDDKSGAVQAVLLAGQDGALEFQAFAAPRGGDLWSEVRPQIAADISRRGGTVTEREGRFGTELVCQVPVQLPEGKTGTQPSRIIGVNGPRWMLRASLLGRPALDPDNAGDWDDALAQIVVRRGDEARPVGEPLGLELPDTARRVG